MASSVSGKTSLLNPRIDVVISRLSHALWSPQDANHLLAIAGRLIRLDAYNSQLLSVIGCTTADLAALLEEVPRAIAAGVSTLSSVAEPLALADSHAHPFFSYRGDCPSYIIALTSLPSDHPCLDETEVIVASILTTAAQKNLERSLEDFSAFHQAMARARYTHEPVPEKIAQPGIKKLLKVSLALRRYVEQASENLTDAPELTQLWQSFKSAADGYLRNPTPRRRTPPPRTTQKRARATRTGVPHRDTAALLNLDSPDILVVTEIVPTHGDDDWQFTTATRRRTWASVKRASEIDYSPDELIMAEPLISDRVHDHHSRATSVAAGHHQAKVLSNLSELLRWSTANATPGQIELIISRLNELADAGEHALGATFLLLSLATGRVPRTLVGQIAVDMSSSLASFTPPAGEHSQQPLVVILPLAGALALRVNRAPILTVSTWDGAIQPQHYLVVRDDLDVGRRLQANMQSLGLQVADVVTLSSTEIARAIDEISSRLSDIDYSAQKIWQILPRLMQNESGQNGAMALLTDWRTLNSAVELHYLCIEASTLRARYDAAIDALVGYRVADTEWSTDTPDQPGHVGSPNCPSHSAISRLISDIDRKLSSSTDAVERHNLITLYTLSLLTAGYGIRHAITPSVTLYPIGSRTMLSYREKGMLRQIVLPQLVVEQLKAYSDFRSTQISPLAEKHSPNRLSFFLLDERLHVQPLHPGQFTAYLGHYGITFELQLNSLRRWMFSQLFSIGIRGISTDFYGGHGVLGREPLSPYSSSTFVSLIRIADQMDSILRLQWKVLSA